jgi:hypothetical protein
MTDTPEPVRTDYRMGRSPLDVGMRIRTGEPVPRPGTWEVVDHDCPSAGALVALGPPDEAPPCPDGDGDVTWQLTHLTATVAADHDGPLP